MEPLDLTPEQTDRLRDSYAWHVVDGMDLKTLCTFAAEQISNDLQGQTAEQLAAEIADLYDPETLAGLISEARGE